MSTKNRKRLWRLGFAAAATTVLITAFWPLRVKGTEDTPVEVDRCRSKLAFLDRAIRAGVTGEATLTESEINAHLASILAENPEARRSRGLTIGIERAHLEATEDGARLRLAGRLLAVPFVLELRLADAGGDPARAGTARAQLAPAHLGMVKMGHLPLVPPFRWLVTDRLREMLHGLPYEGRIADHLTAFETADGEIRLEVSG
jgi:hypothetical protein